VKYKIGDHITITDRLKYHIEKNGWSNNMYYLIGNTFEIISVETDRYYISVETDRYYILTKDSTIGGGHWSIPEDSVEGKLEMIKEIMK
jgi:hypothetical protein